MLGFWGKCARDGGPCGRGFKGAAGYHQNAPSWTRLEGEFHPMCLRVRPMDAKLRSMCTTFRYIPIKLEKENRENPGKRPFSRTIPVAQASRCTGGGGCNKRRFHAPLRGTNGAAQCLLPPAANLSNPQGLLAFDPEQASEGCVCVYVSVCLRVCLLKWQVATVAVSSSSSSSSNSIHPAVFSVFQCHFGHLEWISD